MSIIAQQMASLTPPTPRQRLQVYARRLAARPEHDPNEHARRCIRGELWRRSLATRPIPRHRALITQTPTGIPPVTDRRQLSALPSPGR